MGPFTSFKVAIYMQNTIQHLPAIFLSFGILTAHLGAEAPSPNQTARILFLAHQGDHTKALQLYNRHFAVADEHDFELLHRLGLSIVEEGFRQSDPESQLFALFGANIAAHDDANPILEQSLQSRHPQIRLAALGAVCRMQGSNADKALYQALGSPELLIRLEAAHQLCLKKHPQATSQTESLMYKSPNEILPLFPALYAISGDEKAIRILRRMLNDPSEKVRIATILSIAKHGRDDLLPRLRERVLHLNYAQQEALAYALGALKDETSVPKLQTLSKSQYKNVALAAHFSLFQLGKKDSLDYVEKEAKQGNAFAITALGYLSEKSDTLIALLEDPSIQVRVNACLALLRQSNSHCFSTLNDLLIRNKHDLAVMKIQSPGGAFSAWKVISSAGQVLKDDLDAYVKNLNFREDILSKARHLSEPDFLRIAEALLINRQNDLIPALMELLQGLGTPDTIALLKKYREKFGAPLVRNYCNLVLYRLQEPGPYGDQLKQWVKDQNDQALITFRPFLPWQFENAYELTPEETSRLLIGAFEAFAVNRDNGGIEALLDAIEKGHPKNRYALAGLLIRATQ
jgi:HEAT repeat protein